MLESEEAVPVRVSKPLRQKMTVKSSRGAEVDASSHGGKAFGSFSWDFLEAKPVEEAE